MKSRSMCVKAVATIVALGVMVTVFTAEGTRGQTEPRRRAVDLSTGLFGVTPGESASLNFVNAEPRAGRSPVRIEMLFLDADGSVLKASRESVAPGHSAVLILPYSELSARVGRVHLRAVVLPREPGCFIPSLEVFDDATGRTNFTATLADVL